MIHPMLKDAPVGTRFIERYTPDFEVEYEIVEVEDDYYTEHHGNRRGRPTDGSTRPYVLGSWYETDDIEIIYTPEEEA